MSKENKEEKPMKCVWNMGYDCGGEVAEAKMFDDQITIPICETHLEDHKMVMYLHKQKIDVDVILMLSLSARKELYGAYKVVNSEEYKKKSLSKKVEKIMDKADEKV
jgi:hypothetical protein